ncbi:MAG: carboxylating nicotinate-nucleotide diphosphorylase [Candidatus Omnitrophica bacterium]|nr:carboxylating nicotinate-nucleotide diphosphorylase [Candidatus Omnitrophota bacterium]
MFNTSAINRKLYNNIILQALKEDRVHKDITSQTLISPKHRSIARVIIKEPAVVCGITVAKDIVHRIDPKLSFRTILQDGKRVKAGATIAIIKGKTRSLLAAERTLLNFLGFMSGIATQTQTFVQQAKGTKAKIYDTRKTTPALRLFEKYAVTCGGGMNHRFDLYDEVLIKDNHVACMNGHLALDEMVRLFHKSTKKRIIVEVDTIKQFQIVLKECPDVILLDNMTLSQMRKAVSIRNRAKLKKYPQLEASGGVHLSRVKAIAQTGVERISIGALTHQRQSIDVSLEIKDDHET